MNQAVEQHAAGFYKMPRDADQTSSIRLLYDRWAVFFTKNGRVGFCLMRLDEKKAGRSWHST